MFHRDHYGCRRDDVCTVTGIEDGMVVLAHPDGEERRFRPSGNAAWYLRNCEAERIELRAGDRIRWTRNRKAPPRRFDHPRAPDLVNGGEAEIVDIDSRRVRFRDADGRVFNLALNDPQLRPLDHAYCSTVHSAQGRTARAAIAVLEAGGAADRELFHVELSRVSHDFLLLTDDREALVALLEAREGSRRARWRRSASILSRSRRWTRRRSRSWRRTGVHCNAGPSKRTPFPSSFPATTRSWRAAAALSEIEDLPADTGHRPRKRSSCQAGRLAQLRSAGRPAWRRNRQCTNIEPGPVAGARSGMELSLAGGRRFHLALLLMGRRKENDGAPFRLLREQGAVIDHVRQFHLP